MEGNVFGQTGGIDEQSGKEQLTDDLTFPDG